MSGLLHITRGIESVLVRCAQVAAWLVMVEMAVVCIAVACAAAGVSEIADWGTTVLLFGDRLTLNGMGELQWHIFGVLVMFGGLQALGQDRHVRVDFLSAGWSRRRRRAVEIAGHLFLLIPFLVVVIDSSLPGLELAWRSDAGSDYGGLQDTWLVKAVLPVGFAALTLMAVAQTVSMTILMVRPDLDSGPEEVRA